MSNISTQLETIQFHNQSLIVLNHDNKPYIEMRSVVENIGLDWGAQLKRIKRNNILNSTMVIMTTVAKDGKNRELACLPLGYLNGWLFGIDTNRVKPEIRPTLEKYQLECFDVLYNHFMPKIAQQYPNTISSEQRLAIRDAVKSRTERTGEKWGAIYARFYHRFNINKYDELPASKFDEAIEYLGKTDNQLTLLTNDELCILCWLCKAFELMRKNNQKLVEGLYNLKSEYAPSCYSMAFDYLSLIQRAKAILEKKTKHIKPKDEGNQADNWENVLMFIRG